MRLSGRSESRRPRCSACRTPRGVSTAPSGSGSACRARYSHREPSSVMPTSDHEPRPSARRRPRRDDVPPGKAGDLGLAFTIHVPRPSRPRRCSAGQWPAAARSRRAVAGDHPLWVRRSSADRPSEPTISDIRAITASGTIARIVVERHKPGDVGLHHRDDGRRGGDRGCRRS